jgi:N-acyl-phosphatidylethanolamine-hydrolysing phospholipase D
MTSKDITRRATRARDISLRRIAEEKLHHGPDYFINPFTTNGRGGPWKFLRWKLFSPNRFKDQYAEEPIRELLLDWRPFLEQGDCAVLFLRHSCILVRDQDRIFLVDPIFSGLFWFKDFSPIVSGLESMPAPDHVLITHGHYDHLDVSSLRSLPSDTHVITPLGYDDIFNRLGMKNRTQLDWFESYSQGECRVLFLPCHHWTLRDPFTGPNRSLWGSYLIQGASGRTLFISGDAAYLDRYAEIGEAFDIDLAVFNLGAYEPRWFMAQSHMNPAECVRAFQALKARQLLVIHWGTFRLGDEPVHLPPVEMKREMKKAGIEDRLIHLEHGQAMAV